MNFVVLAILATLLVIVLMQLFKKKPTPPPAAPQPDLANLNVLEARAGDVISIAGAGDEMSDLDFTADHYTRCDAGSRHWFELSGPYRERRVQLRVAEVEDVPEVMLHDTAARATLADLGLAEEDLAQMDERQNTADSFEFDNASWLYCLSRETQLVRDAGLPAASYYWEFRENGGSRMIVIRKAEGEPFAVTIYTGIAADDVTVYRPGR